jgi:hypothetical protein
MNLAEILALPKSVTKDEEELDTHRRDREDVP